MIKLIRRAISIDFGTWFVTDNSSEKKKWKTREENERRITIYDGNWFLNCPGFTQSREIDAHVDDESW